MISGTTVTVTRKAMTGRDEMGEPVFTDATETVRNVLWHRATADDMDQSTRLFGVVCNMVFDFPKTYNESLEGCTISLDGKDYRVVGDYAEWYMPENTPGPWNKKAMAVWSDG